VLKKWRFQCFTSKSKSVPNFLFAVINNLIQWLIFKQKKGGHAKAHPPNKYLIIYYCKLVRSSFACEQLGSAARAFSQ
jgi:hypothetical protein